MKFSEPQVTKVPPIARRRRHALRLGPCVLILAICGCNDGLSRVSGVVTLDGAPVEGSRELYGTVSFYRADGGGAPGIGVIQQGGQYEVSTGTRNGLEPGSYRVGVAVKKIHPPATEGGLTRPERLSAPRFAQPEQSGFRADVQPGDNTFDFALTSK